MNYRTSYYLRTLYNIISNFLNSELLDNEKCISVQNLKKYYRGVAVVNDVSLAIDYGKVFGLLGPNGAGKTTIVKILTNLVRPSSGIVKIASDNFRC
jgi:ABC-type multidrug transport system ATPase subunit